MTRFYCLQRQCCVCHLCIVTEHKSHEVILLDEAADNEKGNTMADVLMSRTRENDSKETIRQFHHTASELRDNAQEAEQKIAEIRERERQAIESIETTYVTRLQKSTRLDRQ